MLHHRRCQVRRRGAAVAELAMLLPLLLFLFLLCIDFARVFFYSQTVENSTRNGAIYGSQVYNSTSWQGSGTTYTTLQQATLADAQSLNPALTSSNIQVASGTSNGNPTVAVTSNYTYPLATNYNVPSVFNLGNQMAFSRAVQMRVAPAQPTFP